MDTTRPTKIIPGVTVTFICNANRLNRTTRQYENTEMWRISAVFSGYTSSSVQNAAINNWSLIQANKCSTTVLGT